MSRKRDKDMFIQERRSGRTKQVANYTGSSQAKAFKEATRRLPSSDHFEKQFQKWKKLVNANNTPGQRTVFADNFYIPRGKSKQKEKYISRNVTKPDTGYVPVIPVIISNIERADPQHEVIDVVGHGSKTYRAKWNSIQPGYFGALVERLNNTANPSLFKTPYLYVGNLTEEYQRNLLSPSERPGGNRAKMYIKGGSSGPSVTELTLNMLQGGKAPKMNTLNADLLSYKLIGDRLSAKTAEWVNGGADRYIMKVNDYNIASEVSKVFSTPGMSRETFSDRINDIVTKILFRNFKTVGTSRVPLFIFKKSAVFTNDRSLCLYCAFLKVPFIYEQGGTMRYMSQEVVNGVNLNSFTDPVLKNIFENGTTRIIDTKLAILDCLHDFVPPSRGFGFEHQKLLLNFLKTVNKNEEIDAYINIFSLSPTAFHKAQEAITNELIRPEATEYDGNALKTLLVKNGMSLTVDAGDLTGLPNKSIRTYGLARFLNSASRKVNQVGSLLPSKVNSSEKDIQALIKQYSNNTRVNKPETLNKYIETFYSRE